MKVVVINTGTELLLGAVINSHLAFIAREISSLGLRVDSQMTVPDGPAIQAVLKTTFSAAQIIFVTGGLGPTTDDITREAASSLLGLPLRRDPELAAVITERLRVRGFPMTDRILRQAEVPQGARVLPNANGTAPGLYLAARGKGMDATPHLFLLPGPPRELEPMFAESVLPILREIAPRSDDYGCRTFRLACVGESMVEAAVGPQLLEISKLELGYCARPGEVEVRVIGPESALATAESIIRQAFPLAVYSDAGENLETVVVEMLRARGRWLTTAESCTGGYLANRLTNVPGSSAVIRGGFVTYANELKTAALGVKEELIVQHGAVSAEVAGAMAEGALQAGKAHFALATTGIAGPDGGSEAKPVGTVYIALASDAGETEVLRRRFLAERPTFKHLVSQTAFQMLRERLLKTDAPE